MLSGLVLLLAPGTWHLAPALAKQPQAQQGQPLSALNAKYVNGVVPGYWPTVGTGLTLNLNADTALCGSPPAPVTYAGGTLTMTAAATSYVYLDPLLSCAPASNTSGFGVGQIPIAVVVANSSGITTVNDVRSWFSPPVSMDSTGRSIVKGLNGAYFADQLGDKSTTGIASGVSACGTSTPCRVVVPGSYPTTESVPGGTTSGNIDVFDYRYGEYRTVVNPAGNGSNENNPYRWTGNWYNSPGLNTYAGHDLFELKANLMDRGVNLELGGYYEKSSVQALSATTNNYTWGVPSNGLITNQFGRVGDSAILLGGNTCYGGRQTQGEEGCLGIDMNVFQGNTAYQATISSGGTTGSTSLTLSPTAGSGTQGAGGPLINTTAGKIINAGTISAISGASPPVLTGNGTSWPVSTVNTTSTEAVTAQGVATVTLASCTNITTSTVLLFYDSSYPEFLIPSAVVSSPCSITANFTGPHASGAYVTSGGLSGYGLELTADTVASGTTGGTAIRQLWLVIASTSSTSLLLGVQSQGQWRGLSTGFGTQWQNSGGSNGYVLYPAAIVSSVYAAGVVGNTFTLESNSVAWANSDTVELPLHWAGHVGVGNWSVQSWWPQNASWGPTINFNGVAGQGTVGLQVTNNTAPTVYNSDGGILNEPRAAYQVNGPWASGIEFQNTGPGTTGLQFDVQGFGSTSSPDLVYPFSFNSTGGGDYLAYNRFNGTYIWTTGFNPAFPF
jgi:hypothetical protein